MTRLGAALFGGLLAGAAAALVFGAAFDLGEVVGFWGMVWGVLVGTATFGLLLALLGRARSRSWGRWILAAVLATVALGTAWSFGWGLPPVSSLEGAWMWPLFVGSACAAILVAAWPWLARRRRR